MGAYDDRTYEVGKGKPPKNTRWPKGKSGNPKGRKRKVSTSDFGFTEMLAMIMNELVTVVIDGKELRITQKELILRGLVRAASVGKPHERGRAVDRLLRAGAFDLNASDGGQSQEQRETAILDVVNQLAAEAQRDLDWALEHAATQDSVMWQKEVNERRRELGLA